MITGITGITRGRIAQHVVTNSRYFENCAFTGNLMEAPGSLKTSEYQVSSGCEVYIYVYTFGEGSKFSKILSSSPGEKVKNKLRDY